MPKNEIHTGKHIENKMDEDGRKAKWLAKQLSCDTSLVHRIYDQQFPATSRLIDISIILETDFFAHYSEYVRRQIENKNRK